MVSPTEIEKKSLEAHVELCAERYKYLHEKLDEVSGGVSTVAAAVSNLDTKLDKVVDKRNDQIIAWGVGIIAVLVSSVTWLLFHYVIK